MIILSVLRYGDMVWLGSQGPSGVNSSGVIEYWGWCGWVR